MPDDSAPAPEVSPPAPPSPAMQRFQACRWRSPQAQEPAYCAHRDVLPMAGTAAFNPDAWCPDCGLYKLRRIVKKPEPGPRS